MTAVYQRWRFWSW